MLKSQKQIGLAALLSLFSISMYAAAFDGFYFGGGLGGSQSNVDVNQNLETKPSVDGTPLFDVVQSNKTNLTDNSFLGNLNLGFGHVFSQRWYLGIEGDAVWQNLEVNASPSTQERVGQLSFTQNTKVELNNQFNVALVPGIVLHENTLLYGKIGAAWGNFDIKNSANYSQVIQPGSTLSSSNGFSDSGYENGLLLGLGIEHYLTKNLSIKLEYTHVNYGTLHDNSPVTSGINNPIPDLATVTGFMADSAGVSASTNSVMLGVAYHLT